MHCTPEPTHTHTLARWKATNTIPFHQTQYPMQLLHCTQQLSADTRAHMEPRAQAHRLAHVVHLKWMTACTAGSANTPSEHPRAE